MDFIKSSRGKDSHFIDKSIKYSQREIIGNWIPKSRVGCRQFLEVISTPKKQNLGILEKSILILGFSTWMIGFHHKLAEERTCISFRVGKNLGGGIFFRFYWVLLILPYIFPTKRLISPIFLIKFCKMYVGCNMPT